MKAPTATGSSSLFSSQIQSQAQQINPTHDHQQKNKNTHLTLKPGDVETIKQVNALLTLSNEQVEQKFKELPSLFPLLGFDKKSVSDVKSIIKDYRGSIQNNNLGGIIAFLGNGVEVTGAAKSRMAGNTENKTNINQSLEDLHNIAEVGTQALTADLGKVEKAIVTITTVSENFPGSVDNVKLDVIRSELLAHKPGLEAAEGWDKAIESLEGALNDQAAQAHHFATQNGLLEHSLKLHQDQIEDLNLKLRELDLQIDSSTDQDEIAALSASKNELLQKCDINKLTISDLKKEIDALKDQKIESDTANGKLKQELSAAKNKRGESSSHIAELVAGIVALAASATVFMVALIPKDSETSENTTDGSIDNTPVQAELQAEISELQTQESNQTAAITALDSLSGGSEEVSAGIEQKIATLTTEEDAIITAAGDKAYENALNQAKITAMQDPNNQVFTQDDEGHVVSTGQLTPEAQGACEEQANEARAAAQEAAKQTVDQALIKLGQLDTSVQTAGDRSAELAQQIATNRIATQARLEDVTTLYQQIPDSTPTVTTNIENSNTNLSKAGFGAALGTASALALGGTGLIMKFAITSHKRKKDNAAGDEVPSNAMNTPVSLDREGNALIVDNAHSSNHGGDLNSFGPDEIDALVAFDNIDNESTRTI